MTVHEQGGDRTPAGEASDAEAMCRAPAELEECEARLARRQIETPAQLDGLLADEFREFGASGREHTRREVIADYGYGSPVHCEITEYRLAPLGADVLLATYQTEQSGGRRALRSSLWTKRQGRWRLMFHQGTLIP